MIGHIKYVKQGIEGRFGHIVPEGKKVEDKPSHVFFHEENLEEGSRIPAKGEEVEYALIPHCPWLSALWVRPINKRSYAPVREMKKMGSGD